MNPRAREIEAEIEGLAREGERILAHLETLKTQFDRGLISRPLYEKTFEEAKARLASIDERIPALTAEKERLEEKGRAAPAPQGAAALEPPAVRTVPPAPARPAAPAAEDRLKGVAELQSQLQQLVERQARLEAHIRELDRILKTEFQRFADMVKPMPSALEKLQEDISTARIEIKALKYETEALNTLQEDRLRSLEEAVAGKRK